ncbi:hypothetical protein [Microvirga aerophila]|uniref:hypothetical protein n=1 Tax=Microvirga aerophila TaxID=670291 RepID=UPI0011BF6235|nr:hypothetical protein [Microvirga aerophila]
MDQNFGGSVRLAARASNLGREHRYRYRLSALKREHRNTVAVMAGIKPLDSDLAERPIRAILRSRTYAALAKALRVRLKRASECVETTLDRFTEQHQVVIAKAEIYAERQGTRGQRTPQTVAAVPG